MSRPDPIAHSIGLGVPGVPSQVAAPRPPAGLTGGYIRPRITKGKRYPHVRDSLEVVWTAHLGELTGEGRTPDEALGALVRCHAPTLGFAPAQAWDWPEDHVPAAPGSSAR